MVVSLPGLADHPEADRFRGTAELVKVRRRVVEHIDAEPPRVWIVREPPDVDRMLVGAAPRCHPAAVHAADGLHSDRKLGNCQSFLRTQEAKTPPGPAIITKAGATMPSVTVPPLACVALRRSCT